MGDAPHVLAPVSFHDDVGVDEGGAVIGLEKLPHILDEELTGATAKLYLHLHLQRPGLRLLLQLLVATATRGCCCCCSRGSVRKHWGPRRGHSCGGGAVRVAAKDSLGLIGFFLLKLSTAPPALGLGESGVGRAGAGEPAVQPALLSGGEARTAEGSLKVIGGGGLSRVQDDDVG